MKTNDIAAIAIVALLGYLVYLFLQNKSANAAAGSGTGQLGIGINGDGINNGCLATICAGSPL
jgi:hypothetical protein